MSDSNSCWHVDIIADKLKIINQTLSSWQGYRVECNTFIGFR